MSNYSLEQSRKKLKEVGREINAKKGIIEGLEKGKELLIATRTELENSNISVEGKVEIINALNDQNERVIEKSRSVSDELGKNLRKLEEIVEETQEAKSSIEVEQKKIENRAKLLEKLHMSGIMDRSVEAIKKEDRQVEEVLKSAISIRKEAEGLSTRASHL